MNATDIYIRLVDPTAKHDPVINHHRVWDRDRFYNAQCKLHENPKKEIADRRLVSLATEAEYSAARKAGK
jgi:hypothetical protein